MNTKPILAAILLLALTLTLFAGCIDLSEGGGGIFATAAPIPSVTTTTPTTVPYSNIPAELSLKILVMNGVNGYDLHEREKMNVWGPFVQMCREKNLTIEWQIVEQEQYAQTLRTLLSGNVEKMPDAFWFSEAYLPEEELLQAVDGGRITEIGAILAFSGGGEDSAKAWFEEHPECLPRTVYNGKSWWVESTQTVLYKGQRTALGQFSPIGVNVRLDWYDQLVAEGHWVGDLPNTAQELTAFLEACREHDVNWNGEKDEVYVSQLEDLTGTGLNTMFGVPRQHFAVNLETGKVDAAWKTGDVKGMLSCLHSWQETGLIPSEMIETNKTAIYRAENKAAAFGSYYYDCWSVRNCDVPEGAAEAIVVGVLPDVEVHKTAYIARGFEGKEGGLAFTSNLSHPAAGAALLDIITGEQWSILMEWGTEGESYQENPETGEKYYLYDHKPPTSSTGSQFPTFSHPGITTGERFFETALPWLCEEFDLLEDEMECYYDPSGVQMEIFQKALQWPVRYNDDVQSYLAPATKEERMILAELEDNYRELSKELFRKLVTGEIPTEELNGVLSQLEAAGMSRLQAVYQARADRFFAAMETNTTE